MSEYSIDTLKIEVQADTKDARKGINALKNTLKKLADVTKTANAINSELTAKLNKISEAMTRFSAAGANPQLATAIKNMKAFSNLNFGALSASIRSLDDGAAAKLSALAQSIQALGSADKGISALRKLSGIDLTGLSLGLMDLPSDGIGKLEQLAQAMRALGEAPSGNVGQRVRELARTASVPKVEIPRADSVIQSASPIEQLDERRASPIEQLDEQRVRSISNALGEVADKAKQVSDSMRPAAVNKFSDAFKHLWKVLGGGRGVLGGVAKALGGISRTIWNAMKGAGGLAAKLLTLNRHAKKSGNSFGGLGSALKTTLLYTAASDIIQGITNAVVEGTQKVYEYSRAINGSLAGSLDSLATGFTYLRNSIGAAASPIIEAIAPAIDYVIDKAVALFNVLNQIFSRLAGKSTWTKAVKVATAFGDAADSAGGAAKKAGQAAKDMAMAFDELNVIDQDSGGGSGGGGGGGSSGGGVSFTEVPIDNDIANWTDQIKDMIQNGEWAELGTLLGEKLNELIDMVPWAEWGKKFGQGIQNALEFTYAFLTTVRWDKLGAGISTFLNEAMYQVDWELAGKTLAAGANALVDVVSGFVLTLDWKAVGNAISDGIKGAVFEFDWEALGTTIDATMSGVGDMLIAATEDLPWHEIGVKLATPLTTINWEETLGKIGEGLGNIITGLPQTLLGYVETVPWAEVGTGIGTALQGIDFSDAFVSLVTAFTTTLRGLTTLVDTALDEETIDQLSSEVADAINDADWSEIIASAGELAITLVDKIWQFLKELVRKIHWGELVIEIGKGLFSISVDFGELIDSWLDSIFLWVAEALRDMLDSAFPGLELGTALYNGMMNTTLNPEKEAEMFAELERRAQAEAAGAVEIVQREAAAYGEDISGAFDGAQAEIAEAITQGGESMSRAAEGVGRSTVLAEQHAIENSAAALLASATLAMGTSIVHGVAGALNMDANGDSKYMYDMGAGMVGGMYNGVDTESPTVTGLFTTMSGSILGIVGGIWSAMTLAIPLAWILIKAALNLATTQSADKVNANMDVTRTHIAKIWSDVKFDAETAWFNIRDTLTQKSREAADALMNTMSGLEDSLSSVWSSMSSAARSAMDGISSSVRNMASSVSSAARSMQSALNSVSSSASSVTASVKTVVASVPQYASGGYPDEGELFLAREAGPELVGSIGRRTAVANNDQIIEGIREGVAQAMRETQGSNQGNMEVRVYLDGKQITAAVEKRQRQRGATIYPGGVVSGV